MNQRPDPDNQASEPSEIIPATPKGARPYIPETHEPPQHYPSHLHVTHQHTGSVQPTHYPPPSHPHPAVVIHQSNPAPSPVVIVQAPVIHSNGLGVAGLVFSILGLFTCGVASLIGLPLSLIALYKAPRGAAIAGSIISGLVCVGYLICWILGLGALAAPMAALGWLGLDAAKNYNSGAQNSIHRSVAEKTLTLEKFNRVEKGMSYQDAVGVIGFEGEELSRVALPGALETVMYSWKKPGQFEVANMNATFQGGKLVSKAQLGLK